MARTKSGSLRRRGKTWFIRYYRNGRRFEESTHTEKESEARAILRRILGDIERGIPVTPRLSRFKFEEAAKDLLNDYRVNGRRSLNSVERRVNVHLAGAFAGRRMASITTADVNEYIVRRKADTITIRRATSTEPALTKSVSDAEINRELAALKRMFRLAIQGGKLMTRPHIPMLVERNVRKGFFEPHQFLAVLEHLPEAVRPVAEFAYLTGWRIPSEVLTREWRQVDLKAGTVTLDANKTKNGEPRVFKFAKLPQLREILERQETGTAAAARRLGKIIPSVFHRDGVPIRNFYGAWHTACAAAGVPGRIPHDFRRTAVRNLVRAGVPERVAMQLTGHKTRSVFERYNIVSDADLDLAAERLASAVTSMAIAQ